MRFILSLIYGLVVVCRGWLYDRGILKSYRSFLPVISVGNITAGGNGKTPLCLAIAFEMHRRGYSPAILSRGYGGKVRGPHRVSPSDPSSDVGDEAVLMAFSGFPVFIARKRVAGIKLIESDSSVDLVILDDGFQHRALARSLDIVSIFVGSKGAVDELSAGKMLPLGMFREPRDRSLRRADLIVLSNRAVQEPEKLNDIDPRIAEILPRDIPIFRSFLRADSVTNLVDNTPVAPQRVCALAAIANPEGFFKSLEVLGFDLVKRYVFPDHHRFSEEELASVVNAHSDTTFVCTSKDGVKISELSDHLRARFAVLKVTAELVPSDAFFVRIERAIAERRNERVG